MMRGGGGKGGEGRGGEGRCGGVGGKCLHAVHRHTSYTIIQYTCTLYSITVYSVHLCTLSVLIIRVGRGFLDPWESCFSGFRFTSKFLSITRIPTLAVWGFSS